MLRQSENGEPRGELLCLGRVGLKKVTGTRTNHRKKRTLLPTRFDSSTGAEWARENVPIPSGGLKKVNMGLK